MATEMAPAQIMTNSSQSMVLILSSVRVCVCVWMFFFLNNSVINIFCICIVTLFWDSRGREWFSANRVVNKTMVKLWCLRLAAVVGGEDDGNGEPWLYLWVYLSWFV